MIVNGKELKMFYSIGAKCEIDEIMLNADAPDLPTYIAKYGGTKADIMYAAAMSRAYCEAHKEEELEPITEAELKAIPFNDFSQLDAEVSKALGLGQTTSVEAEPPKKAKRTSNK